MRDHGGGHVTRFLQSPIPDVSAIRTCNSLSSSKTSEYHLIWFQKSTVSHTGWCNMLELRVFGFKFSKTVRFLQLDRSLLNVSWTVHWLTVVCWEISTKEDNPILHNNWTKVHKSDFKTPTADQISWRDPVSIHWTVTSIYRPHGWLETQHKKHRCQLSTSPNHLGSIAGTGTLWHQIHTNSSTRQSIETCRPNGKQVSTNATGFIDNICLLEQANNIINRKMTT